MKLFIAENPSLARAIAAGIGVGKNFNGYISLNGGNEIVTWCFGHILENFKPVTYYSIQAVFKNNFGEIPATWQMSEKIQNLDSEGRLLDKKIAESFLEKFNSDSNNLGKIISVEEKNKLEPQRLPYSLSTLQIESGKKFGYSPQIVLDTMQNLYEKKLTTYPRSDCEFLPENQFGDAKEILENLKNLSKLTDFAKNADISIKSRAWNDKKISAHHAIIPTRLKPDFENLNEVEKNLYLMVSQAYLAQFFPAHEYKSTKIIISFAGEKFVGKGKNITKLGWKSIYKNFSHDDSEESILPQIAEGEPVKYISGKILEKTTKPPTKFTPSTLLQAMKEIFKFVKNDSLKAELKECSGIGTEATRAGIIEKLQSSGFLKLAGKFFEPTEKARMAVKILPDEIIFPDTTAIWEKNLEGVATGKENFDTFYKNQLCDLKKLLEKAKKLR